MVGVSFKILFTRFLKFTSLLPAETRQPDLWSSFIVFGRLRPSSMFLPTKKDEILYTLSGFSESSFSIISGIIGTISSKRHYVMYSSGLPARVSLLMNELSTCCEFT